MSLFDGRKWVPYRLSASLLLVAAGSIVRPWLVHRVLPEIPPKHKSLVYILCLSALAECGYSHGPYYVYEKQLSFVLTARNTISILFFLKLFSSS